ncbi:uncharacterized protein LOC114786839 [Denticeps clupeoides]|uniref:uncharacterized protein LOC114786839 n=1 Tax=Denticeps clupeoides TaxID=299321 RepID=UPI0010A5468D|nr:uncharacterized protein LOC114786839 [Denticeps clupeoides]
MLRRRKKRKAPAPASAPSAAKKKASPRAQPPRAPLSFSRPASSSPPAFQHRARRRWRRGLGGQAAALPVLRPPFPLAGAPPGEAPRPAARGPRRHGTRPHAVADDAPGGRRLLRRPSAVLLVLGPAPDALLPGEGGVGPRGGVLLALALPALLRRRRRPPPPKKTPAPTAAPPRKPESTPAASAAPPNPPAKRGRRPKRVKEEQQKQEELQRAKEERPPTPGGGKDEDGEAELSDGRDEDSQSEKNGDMENAHRTHMSPLLSSLSCLVLYLRRQQHSAYLSLSRTPNSAEAWRLLCHSSLALLILYNRHRECEVAKLTVQEYRNRFTPPASAAPAVNGAAQAPAAPGAPALETALSPFERQVLCHLPRVGVLGKRGRMQPLVLPPHSEACLELLLQTCPDVGVDPKSPYVFSRPYHSPATPLRGTDLLRGLARSSGAKNPAGLTAPRARRQVAILTQLLLLEEGERKRLEDFLQREYHVTQSCARIGQDPGLMGRVGRVVLYGEKDGMLFRGMSLQHICLELDVMSGNSADSFSEESDVEAAKSKERVEVSKKAAPCPPRPPSRKKGSSPQPAAVTPSPVSHKRRSSQPKSGKRGVLKRPWSEAERVAVETHLKRNIVELRVPAKADCERCLQLCPLLVSNQRDWRAIKFYCHNRIQLLKKQGRRESGAAAVC